MNDVHVIERCRKRTEVGARKSTIRRRDQPSGLAARIVPCDESALVQLRAIGGLVETDERKAFAKQQRTLDELAVGRQRVESFRLGHRGQTFAEIAFAV